MCLKLGRSRLRDRAFEQLQHVVHEDAGSEPQITSGLRSQLLDNQGRLTLSLLARTLSLLSMGDAVGQLIVRDLDDELIRALKVRAAQRRRSAEAEHREILREALASRREGTTLKDLLLKMPTVGEDADFARPRDLGRKTKL